MNKAILIGNLTRDPDSRTTANGIAVCTFSIAINRQFKTQSGEKQTDFIPIVCWRGLAENCSKYLHKGSKIAVLGAIQTRTYEAQDGSKRYVTEVVADEVQFLDRANQEGGSSAGASTPSMDPSDIEGFTTVEDEGLPF